METIIKSILIVLIIAWLITVYCVLSVGAKSDKTMYADKESLIKERTNKK